MTHSCYGSRVRWTATLCTLTACLLARSASAMPPDDGSSAPAPGATTPSGAAEPEAFCRDHWLAVAQCHDRSSSGLRLMFGLDLGVVKMTESGPFGFGNGVGSVTDAGPSWGVRAGLELLSWLAFEARYVGTYAGLQSSVSPAGTLGFLATAGEVVARFTAPLPYVHPYVLGGVGYYDVSLVGGDAARAASPLFSSSQPGIPLGFGLDVPLTWHLSLGAEATYHFQLGESFSLVKTNGIDGGDLSTFDLVARIRL
jgi:Outer membrane protein beta-barrel domain